MQVATVRGIAPLGTTSWLIGYGGYVQVPHSLTYHTVRPRKEAKGTSPYASLDEAREALDNDFRCKNVHFREVGTTGHGAFFKN